MGNIIFIKKRFIYLYTFIYFQRARAFFPRILGQRYIKSFLRKTVIPEKKYIIIYYWLMRIWTRRRRFLWFEYSFTQKNNLILYVLGTSFLQNCPTIPKKIRLRRALIIPPLLYIMYNIDEGDDSVPRPYLMFLDSKGIVVVAGTCRDRLHSVLAIVHQSDRKFWETSFSLRNFLYSFLLLYTFSARAHFSHGRRGRENLFQVRMA